MVYACGYHDTRTCSSRSPVRMYRPSGARISAVRTDVCPSTSAGGSGSGGACSAYACTSPNLSPIRIVVPSAVSTTAVGFFETSLRRRQIDGREGKRGGPRAEDAQIGQRAHDQALVHADADEVLVRAVHDRAHDCCLIARVVQDRAGPTCPPGQGCSAGSAEHGRRVENVDVWARDEHGGRESEKKVRVRERRHWPPRSLF